MEKKYLSLLIAALVIAAPMQAMQRNRADYGCWDKVKAMMLIGIVALHNTVSPQIKEVERCPIEFSKARTHGITVGGKATGPASKNNALTYVNVHKHEDSGKCGFDIDDVYDLKYTRRPLFDPSDCPDFDKDLAW